MKIPNHLAIIMDGNGRWAQQRNKPRSYGHVKGTRVAKEIITSCSKMGVKSLTLYAFSTENWYRPEQEVSLLMAILQKYLLKETANLIKENIRFSIIGETDKLPEAIKKTIHVSMEKTKSCTGLHLVFALSYGSRQEITNAIKSIAASVKNCTLNIEDITEDTIQNALQTSPQENPDLIIRTSGELRLSNFLLWQAAYSEFYFTPVLWPDFKEENLKEAFQAFSQRQRRFGKVLDNHAELNH